jgi:SpoVK/Ycf46/Vps4 family AAA+-type ATPase
MDSGFPEADARTSFSRERRRSALSSIASRLRHEPDDVSAMLPFEEVVAALGRRSQRDLGVQPIPLDAIVGTVDRRHGEFDRSFRPASPMVRGRWERIAAARRRGETMPPIEVYKIGDLYFVEDGHHRVSVARALGDEEIEAHVREVHTQLGADRALLLRELPLKRHERIFYERVPLPREARGRIQLSDEWRYAQLATLIESWGYRASLERERVMDRPELALRWFREEYEPMVAMLREAEIGGGGTETERYLRVSMLRFLLLQRHDWSEEMAEKLAGEVKSPSPGAEKDTMTHQIIKEMRD